MTELLALGSAFTAGAALASAFWTWRFSPAPRQMELMHHNVALTIISSAAIARLDADDREDVMEEASEQMEDAFGDGAHVAVAEVRPDE